MGDDGSVVVVGATLGVWNIANVGGWDLAAFKLDADGSLMWKWQVAIIVCNRVSILHLCFVWCATLALNSSQNVALSSTKGPLVWP